MTHNFDQQFTEAELNRASVAGINRKALVVAKEYPRSTFGKELRKHIDWGAIDEMAESRREGATQDEVSRYWLGGGFTTSLAFGSLEAAYGAADTNNIRVLVDLFGVPDGMGYLVSDEVMADVEAGNVPGKVDHTDDDATEVTA